jgi:hypothetical protein
LSLTALLFPLQAELARVFSSIHLEQIATTNVVAAEQEGLLGKQDSRRQEGALSARTILCDEVVNAINPFAQGWGVNIINFQLEGTKIADQKYVHPTNPRSY